MSEELEATVRPEGSSALISVVIPVFNEHEVLESTVREVIETLGDRSFEVVLVDDGSEDGSWEVIQRLAAGSASVRGTRLTRNFGHQAALLAGLSEARGRAVVTLDADGQHPPGVIPEMIDRWQAGAAVVQCLRADLPGTGLLKRMSSRAFYRVFSWMAGTRLEPGSADFRLLDRRVVEVMLEHPRCALFQRGFLPWGGFRTDRLDFEPRRRRAGSSKYSLHRMLALAREGILRFSVAPLKLATVLGLITSFTALSYLAYVLLVWVFSSRAVAGWASIAGLLALLGGVQLLVVGILGEYLGMVFQAQLGRPSFIVAERAGEPGAPERK